MAKNQGQPTDIQSLWTLAKRKQIDIFLRNQLKRASISIVLNIAEGSGKFSRADRKNYFVTARASVFECVAILDILYDQRLIAGDDLEAFFGEADELSRILFSMIKNLS